MLRIFADENILSVEDLFRPLGHITTAPGREITADLLGKTDVLLVRSVTRVNADLLKGTPVKFVGSATSGTDHVDKEALRDLGVHFVHAPGSNAASVADYVVAAVLCLSVHEERTLNELTAAVVGCGEVGGRVVERFEGLGLRVRRSDPPLHDKLRTEGRASPFVDIDTAISEADVVTIHVPLHDLAPYGTFELLDANRISRLRRTAWFFNTSRGEVVDEEALIQWLDAHARARAVIDVWTNEPNVSCRLVHRSSFATPHIAGYAVEGKLRAARMLRKALLDWAGVVHEYERRPEVRTVLHPPARYESDHEWLHQLARSAYDIESDHRAFLPICDLAEDERGRHFDAIRRNYPTRHEMSRYFISETDVPFGLERAVKVGLGMKVA